MYQTSDMNLDVILKDLVENDLGFVLIQADNEEQNIFDVLSSGSHKDVQRVKKEDGTYVGYRLFALMYNKPHICDWAYTESRADGISDLFTRWDRKGYNKHNARNPYKCKSFINFLQEIQWDTADYMLLKVAHAC